MVARTLGISRTTVSNAYNRPDQLSPQLRERILRTADNLGYPGPNPIARSLRTARAGAIGLVLTESMHGALRDPAAMEFFEAFIDVCEQNRTGVLLLPARRGARAVEAIRGAVVDSFVIYLVPNDDPVLRAVVARSLPTVIVDGGIELPRTTTINVNDVTAATDLADYLGGLGHRRVAIVSTPLVLERSRTEQFGAFASIERQRASMQRVAADRLLGLAQGFDRHGVNFLDVPVFECAERSVAAGRYAAQKLLERDPSLSAIVCLSDVLAEGVLSAAADCQRAVPEQLSVSGFDDVPVAAQLGLTTVGQGLTDKGRLAAEILLEGSSSDPERILLDAKLRIRSTTGPPAT